jgi:hypothetical protein
MARCLSAGLAAGGVVWGALWSLGRLSGRWLPAHQLADSRWTDLAVLAVGSVLWIVIARWTLEKTGSALPKVALKRLGLS